MRVRITFSKTGGLKYIGHLDLQSIWERAARRAGLPLAYTNAFHPQPKIYFASALPLGFTSRCEVVDMRFSQGVDLAGLPERLQSAMPPGIGILKVVGVDEQGPALQTQVVAAEYEVTLTENMAVRDPSLSPNKPAALGSGHTGMALRMKDLLEKPSLPRERRGKTYDLRPLIEKLEAVSEDRIFMRLTAREAATGRPEEVLDALGIAVENAQIERINLIFQG
jgi:radical SAM-linked protein